MSGRRRLLAAALLIVGTILLAPLLYGVAKGLFAGSNEGERRKQSIALLAAYLEYRPQEPSLLSFDADGAIVACGYQPEALFSSADRAEAERERPWTAYGGYFDLLTVRARDWDQRLHLLRLTRLDAETAAFSSEFLRVCIRQSLFAPFCASRVGAILAADDLDPAKGDAWPRNRSRPDQSRQTGTICAYVDGIAARRGVRLATRP